MKPGADIRGQERAWTILNRAVTLDRVAHAYLFHGPRGLGKCTVGWDFAGLLLCSKPSENLSCGRCPSCKVLPTGDHPDFDVFGPHEKGRAIPIESIRELCRRASLKPSIGTRRVFLVDEAQDLTEEAANSLLKTLEEPPAGTVIILVTHKPDGLLPTILSRTQHVAFQSLEEGECARVLMERHGLPPTEASLLVALSGGAPGRALTLREAPAFEKRADIIEAILAVDLPSLFDKAAGLIELGRESGDGDTTRALREGLRLVFSIAGAFLRDVEVSTRTSGRGKILLADQREEIEGASRKGTGGWALPALAALEQAREGLERNVNPGLTVEWWLSELVKARAVCEAGP
ncbi:MAG: DNA polymerase III subunit delta' [Planctomycetota bacterium]|jgi:DNA polymerase-3 subunit delta'